MSRYVKPIITQTYGDWASGGIPFNHMNTPVHRPVAPTARTYPVMEPLETVQVSALLFQSVIISNGEVQNG